MLPCQRGRRQSSTFVRRSFKLMRELSCCTTCLKQDVENPDSFGYHTSDMIEFLSLARMAALTGIDLYNWRNAHGSTMKTTVEWLAPFCRNSSSWPYPQIHIPNPWLQRCRYIYRVAANVWQNASWEELASDRSLPADADGFFTFGLDMPSFVTLLYPSTLKNATATTTTTATALRPAIGSAIWVASQGRRAVPPEAVTMLPTHVRARSAAEQAMGSSAFGLGPQFVDGMRMAVFPGGTAAINFYCLCLCVFLPLSFVRL